MAPSVRRACAARLDTQRKRQSSSQSAKKASVVVIKVSISILLMNALASMSRLCVQFGQRVQLSKPDDHIHRPLHLTESCSRCSAGTSAGVGHCITASLAASCQRTGNKEPVTCMFNLASTHGLYSLCCSASLVTLCLNRVLQGHALRAQPVNGLAQGADVGCLLHPVEDKSAGLQYQ